MIALPAILHPAALPVKDRGGGIRTTPLVTAGVGSTQMLNGITMLDPGAAVPLHIHNCEESVLLLSGDAIATIDGIEHRLSPGDTSWIPAGILLDLRIDRRDAHHHGDRRHHADRRGA
jgi:quercetin dioxygenase-like cupin family protein